MVNHCLAVKTLLLTLVLVNPKYPGHDPNTCWLKAKLSNKISRSIIHKQGVKRPLHIALYVYPYVYVYVWGKIKVAEQSKCH